MLPFQPNLILKLGLFSPSTSGWSKSNIPQCSSPSKRQLSGPTTYGLAFLFHRAKSHLSELHQALFQPSLIPISFCFRLHYILCNYRQPLFLYCHWPNQCCIIWCWHDSSSSHIFTVLFGFYILFLPSASLTPSFLSD